MPLITKKKGSQLRRSTSAIAEGRTKPLLSADYIVGLVDGEGCFYVNVPKSERYNAGARVELGFYIKMQEKDRPVLERVKQTIGCGAVYYQKETRPNHCQCFRYTVTAHRDVLDKIIPFFLRHPLQCPSKLKNFRIFSKIVELVRQRKHLTEEGVRQIRLYKTQMNQRTSGLA
jgi:hypothetical protein